MKEPTIPFMCLPNFPICEGYIAEIHRGEMQPAAGYPGKIHRGEMQPAAGYVAKTNRDDEPDQATNKTNHQNPS